MPALVWAADEAERRGLALRLVVAVPPTDGLPYDALAHQSTLHLRAESALANAEDPRGGNDGEGHRTKGGVTMPRKTRRRGARDTGPTVNLDRQAATETWRGRPTNHQPTAEGANERPKRTVHTVRVSRVFL
ncbi:hypothetical protein [Streptomyces tritici]|uniref:hypothetical protein n=1 Tax=Streptomyces tritici TaxID=2054410 RepID=UPI003AF1A38F